MLGPCTKNRSLSGKSPLLLLFLLSIGFIYPVHAQAQLSPNHYPEFSWDRIPLYMHIRKATTFTPEEVEYIARFPLITFEKATGHKSSGSIEKGTLIAARAVKEVNPQAKILFYRNVFVHYGGYAANEWFDDQPELLLTGQDGNTKLVRDKVQAYDLSHPEVREWWLNFAVNMTRFPSIDGLFLDGNIKALEPGYLSRDLGKKKKAKVAEGYHLMLKELRDTLASDQLIVGNILRARFAEAGLEHLEFFDGSYLEGFFQNVGKASYEDYVVKGIDAMQQAARQGKIIAFTTGLASSASESHMGIDEVHSEVGSNEEAQANLIYPLALFLICAEPYSYFRVHEGYSADRNDRWMRWFEEYDRPLGPPLGPAEKKDLQYLRRFKNAIVFLDVGNRRGKIKWRLPPSPQHK